MPPLYAHDPLPLVQATLCHPALDGLMILLTRTCEGPGLALLAFAGALAYERRLWRALRMLGAVVVVLLVTGAAVQLLKNAWPMPRPLAVLGESGVRVLLEPLRGRAFPSGHSAAAGAVGALLTFRYGPRAWPFWILALSGALSRVYVGAHWTLDVVAGLALGVVAAASCVALASLAPRLRAGSTFSGKDWRGEYA